MATRREMTEERIRSTFLYWAARPPREKDRSTGPEKLSEGTVKENRRIHPRTDSTSAKKIKSSFIEFKKNFDWLLLILIKTDIGEYGCKNRVNEFLMTLHGEKYLVELNGILEWWKINGSKFWLSIRFLITSIRILVDLTKEILNVSLN